MSIYYLSWSFGEVSQEVVKRHCPSCGGVVAFKDTLKRRQNANGKNIYEYAIFKCEKDHTWNKKLRTVKAFSGLENKTMECASVENKNQDIEYEDLIKQEIRLICIVIEQVESRCRLDVVLASRIKGVSRSQIQRRIQQGTIQVNSSRISPRYFLRSGDTITIETKNVIG